MFARSKTAESAAEDASRLEALCTATKVGIEDIEAGRFKAFESANSLRSHTKTLKTTEKIWSSAGCVLRQDDRLCNRSA